MMTASGADRPPSGLATAPMRVLWVGPASESWLALSRAVRSLGGESLQVSSLEALGPELARTRPALVLVHWRQVTDTRWGLGLVRARAEVPVALVAEADTPAEVLEAAETEAVEDCLLAPLRVPELRARLAALTGGTGPVRSVERFSPRVVLMAGASGARAWGGVGRAAGGLRPPPPL